MQRQTPNLLYREYSEHFIGVWGDEIAASEEWEKCV